LPKTTISQIQPKETLASNVVDFFKEREKMYKSKGVEIVRSSNS